MQMCVCVCVCVCSRHRSPGIYNLSAALEVSHQNQIVLGLGLATLIATGSDPAIRVKDVPGVRVAGILLQAGTPVGMTSPKALLVWGTIAYAGRADMPGFLHDVYARVGGPGTTQVHVATTNSCDDLHTDTLQRIRTWSTHTPDPSILRERTCRCALMPWCS
jgi:hypothetical protein